MYFFTPTYFLIKFEFQELPYRIWAAWHVVFLIEMIISLPAVLKKVL